MMKKSILLFVLFGCATKPDGVKTLSAMVKSDLLDQKHMSKNVSEGRPIFIKSYAYPQVTETGDIFGGGWVHIYVGREKVDFEQVIGTK